MGVKQEEEMERIEGGVVVVNPKPSKGITSKAIDWLEKLIVKLMYDSSQPHHYLSGNFAPVIDETPPCKDLTVIGHLPVSLIIQIPFVSMLISLHFDRLVLILHYFLDSINIHLTPIIENSIHINVIFV